MWDCARGRCILRGLLRSCVVQEDDVAGFPLVESTALPVHPRTPFILVSGRLPRRWLAQSSSCIKDWEPAGMDNGRLCCMMSRNAPVMLLSQDTGFVVPRALCQAHVRA